MLHRFALLAFALLTLAATGAHAQALQPIEVGTFSLGSVTGIVYYTRDAGGYHVVATLQDGKDQTVLRSVVTLAPEQSVTFSTPRGVGEPPVEVRLVRHADGLYLETAGQARPAAAVTNLAARP